MWEFARHAERIMFQLALIGTFVVCGSGVKINHLRPVTEVLMTTMLAIRAVSLGASIHISPLSV
jgi:hypothetical protein